jgi:hypothetical protein
MLRRMKVITQLIRHFWQRGALTVQEIEYLVQHGFIRVRDLPGYNPAARPEPVLETPLIFPEPIPPPGPLEEIQESLVRRFGRRGSGGPRGKVIEAREICRRVKREFHRRETALSSLMELARREPTSDWQDAAVAIRQQSPESFGRALGGSLRHGSVSLKSLWRAIDMEPFHELLDDSEVRGPAARAYFALLVARDAGGLGKYAWVLTHDELRALNNLRVVHDRVLGTVAGIYCRDLRLLTRSLAAGCDPIPFWSLVLLHNAHRARPKAPPVPGKEYGPVDEPDDDTWQQAWTAALQMDRPRITNLLVASYADSTARQKRAAAASTHVLVCPVGWHVPD